MLELYKVAAAVIAVVGLAWLAERLGPKWAGVLSGYPLGTAIVLYFYGVEHGADYAGEAALFGLLGLAATTGFCLCFTLVASRVDVRSWWPMGLALLSLMVLSLLGQSLPALGIAGALVPVAVALISIRLGRVIPEPEFVAVKPSPMMVWGRAVLAAVIVVAITALSHWLPNTLAGVMAAFPVTLFPLMLLLRLGYDNRPVMVISKYYPFGVGSLIVYALAVSWSYPAFGVGLGTLIALLVATAYLLLFVGWQRSRIKRAAGASK